MCKSSLNALWVCEHRPETQHTRMHAHTRTFGWPVVLTMFIPIRFVKEACITYKLQVMWPLMPCPLPLLQVVQDFRYFQRVKWQYMILDEAQAIKSSSRWVLLFIFAHFLCILVLQWSLPLSMAASPLPDGGLPGACLPVGPGSVRWKMLMSFNCRNRLLLTGTPIQNTMAEVIFPCCAAIGVWVTCSLLSIQLWALLHFIMPTMFDSHEEFNEWFSRDIESHAEKKSALDESECYILQCYARETFSLYFL